MNSQGMFIHSREFWNSRYVPTVLTQTYLPSNRTWHVRTKLSFGLAPCPASGVGLAKTQKKNTTSCNHQNKNKQSCRLLQKESWKGLSQTDLQPFSWSVWLNFSHDSAGVPRSEKTTQNKCCCSAVQATSRLSRTSCSYIFLSYRAPVPEFLLILNRSKS